MCALRYVAFVTVVTLDTKLCLKIKASAAFPAMRSRPAIRRLSFYTAKSAVAKPISLAVCSAVHAVCSVVRCENRKRKHKYKQYNCRHISNTFFHTFSSGDLRLYL